MWPYELKLEDGRTVTVNGTDGIHAAHRAADIYHQGVVAWRTPAVQLRVGMGDEP